MNGWYLAARISVASGAVIAALWAPGSIALATWADDAKNWFPIFFAGLLVIGLVFGLLGAALGAIGWAFG